MRLQYEDEQRYQSWCERLLKITWACVLVVMLARALLLVAGLQQGEPAVFLSHMMSVVVVPAIINALVLGVGDTLSHWLFGKRRYLQQALVYVTAVSLVCGCLAWANREVSLVPVLFVVPVVLSLLFIDKRVLLWAFGLNLVLFLLYTVMNMRLPLAGADTNTLGPQTMLAVFIVFYLIARMILRRLQELVQTVLDANHQKKLDSLTGLYNHATFYETLDEYIQQCKKDGEVFALMVLDIDNFKHINDTFGHNVGDDVIMLLVDTIRAHVPQHGNAFRYGGEEFAVLLRAEDAVCGALGERIREVFKDASAQKLETPVTVSVGVCMFDGQRFFGRREFFAAADEALYTAKRTGKDKVVFWQEELV